MPPDDVPFPATRLELTQLNEDQLTALADFYGRNFAGANITARLCAFIRRNPQHLLGRGLLPGLCRPGGRAPLPFPAVRGRFTSYVPPTLLSPRSVLL